MSLIEDLVILHEPNRLCFFQVIGHLLSLQSVKFLFHRVEVGGGGRISGGPAKNIWCCPLVATRVYYTFHDF